VREAVRDDGAWEVIDEAGNPVSSPARPVADDAVFHLWPEHEAALLLWLAVQSQWRHGWNGPTGLDYAGIRAAPAFHRLARVTREAVFADVCVMERGALGAWAEDRAAEKARADAGKGRR
jgi:hypothetical protein